MGNATIVNELEAASKRCFKLAQESMKEGTAQYEAEFTNLAEFLQALADKVAAL